MELLLIGAGYLARKIITQSPNSNIIAFRRQKNSQDLVDKATYKYTDIFRLKNFLVKNVTRTFKGSVVVMLNPSTYPDNLVESVSKVACLFEQNLVKKIILVSSTGIFSDGCENRIDNSYYQPIPVNKRAKKYMLLKRSGVDNLKMSWWLDLEGFIVLSVWLDLIVSFPTIC